MGGSYFIFSILFLSSCCKRLCAKPFACCFLWLQVENRVTEESLRKRLFTEAHTASKNPAGVNEMQEVWVWGRLAGIRGGEGVA